MLLIPAIDLKDGHCVRLKQGDMDDVTVFSEDPAAMAQHWLAEGARRLHLVDLNGAVAGKPKNESVIKAITAAVGDDIPVQLGGGIRDLDTIERRMREIFDGIVYVKGAWVLRTLEEAVGREKFDAFLKGWFTRHKHKAVTTEMLQKELESELGRSFETLFTSAVYGTGLPE